MSSVEHFDAIKQQNKFIETLIIAALAIDVAALVTVKRKDSFSCSSQGNEIAKEKLTRVVRI